MDNSKLSQRRREEVDTREEVVQQYKTYCEHRDTKARGKTQIDTSKPMEVDE